MPRTLSKTVPLPDTCRAGHPYNDANAYLNVHGWRTCRACATERRNRYRARKRAGLVNALAGA